MLAITPRPAGLGRSIRTIASMAGVDGAIVVTSDLQLLGFGAKIAIESTAVPRVCMFQPQPGSQEVVPAPLEDLGGTRHQSAARFADANRDAVSLVISQDRHLSVIESVAVLRNAEWWL